MESHPWTHEGVESNGSSHHRLLCTDPSISDLPEDTCSRWLRARKRTLSSKSLKNIRARDDTWSNRHALQNTSARTDTLSRTPEFIRDLTLELDVEMGVRTVPAGRYPTEKFCQKPCSTRQEVAASRSGLLMNIALLPVICLTSGVLDLVSVSNGELKQFVWETNIILDFHSRP